MKRLLLLLVFVAVHSFGQNLRELNFKHWYDAEDFVFQMHPVRTAGVWETYFALNIRDTSAMRAPVEIHWDVRNSISDREGVLIGPEDISMQQSGRSEIRGFVRSKLSGEVQYLVARIRFSQPQKDYYYFATLESSYPVTNVVLQDGQPVIPGYVQANASLTIPGEGKFFVSHYDDSFPTAPLPFSEALGKVSKGMKVDSTFTITAGEGFSLSRGLSLIQRDTMASEGVALRAEADYPRHTKLRNVAAPLIYICTSQEYDRIRQADGDKKAFDKVILSITKDTDRAKSLMRSYFKRVEGANEFFTSYKEGWKTDRGMIYIIFGPPDEVYRSSDRETWTYKNAQYKVSFDFVRSPSIFDPHNFVLIRERKYKDLWYEVIDLWRNARF